MKTVLIIGNKGYIGSKLMKDFKNLYNLNGIDIGWFSTNPESSIDYNDLNEEYIKSFDSIVLLAGHSSVKMCNNDMQSSFNNNVRNFANLLYKMKENQKLIYASSSSVYGIVGSNTVDETYNNFIPHNDYDVTKYCIDLLAQRSYVQYYGLRFGTVNGYSPIVRNDVMINSMTYNAIINNEIKLYIKETIRPILGINDLSKAIQVIIESDNDNRGIYNLASFSDTAEGIANSVSRITGIKINHYDVDPNNIGNAKMETKSYNFDIDCSKFKETFNFTFKDTAENITKELVENFNKIEFTNRNKNIKYE